MDQVFNPGSCLWSSNEVSDLENDLDTLSISTRTQFSGNRLVNISPPTQTKRGRDREGGITSKGICYSHRYSCVETLQRKCFRFLFFTYRSHIPITMGVFAEPSQLMCNVSWVTSSNRRFPEITGKDNLTVFSYSGRVPWMKAAAEKSRSGTVLDLHNGPIIIYARLPAGETYYTICMFPTNSEH